MTLVAVIAYLSTNAGSHHGVGWPILLLFAVTVLTLGALAALKR